MLNYTEIANQLFIEHNTLRKNPKSYIPLLQSTFPHFRKNNTLLHFPNEKPFKTHNGKTPLQSAINFLSTQLPQPNLTYSLPLSLACTKYLTSSTPLSLWETVEPYCKWEFQLKASFDYGTYKPQYIMLKLLMGDGDDNKLYRNNIFDKHTRYIGIACCNDNTYGIRCMIIYASHIRSLDKINITPSEFHRNYALTLSLYNDIISGKRKDEIQSKREIINDDNNNSKTKRIVLYMKNKEEIIIDCDINDTFI